MTKWIVCLFVCLVKYNPNRKTPRDYIHPRRLATQRGLAVITETARRNSWQVQTGVSDLQVDGITVIRITGLTQAQYKSNPQPLKSAP